MSDLKKLLARRILARRRLLQFTMLTYPLYLAGWVHEDICRRLEKFSADIAAGKSPRLMLLMPPRHGKSELASVRFPAWHLGHYPHHEIINVGYNLDLPMVFSRKVRELVRDPVYTAIFPETNLDPESQSVEKWITKAGGGFMAAGVGGGITGKGAHALIIDDPIKNQVEADSVAVRDNLMDWYQSTAYTRLAPGGGILIIQTMWNDDDLAGRLQSYMAANLEVDQFEIVKYPAISEAWEYRDEATQEILRYPDEQPLEPGITLLRPKDYCLHEARYPTDALKKIRANLQPRIWSALYQQNPVPDTGMYFKKEYFKYQKHAPPRLGMRIFTAWDFAISEEAHNDWTVGVTVLQDETDTLYVIDVLRFKGDSFQIVDAMLDIAERYGSDPSTGYLIGAEDGQIWRALLPLLRVRMEERKLWPPLEVLRPLTDKMARARPLQGRMQQGKIVFMEGAHWLQQAEQELLRFPAGAHDDVVDAMAWVVHLCLGKAPPQLEQPPPLKSWKDKVLVTHGGGSHMTA
jgi:predicted phage terminase large subunit-like protein